MVSGRLTKCPSGTGWFLVFFAVFGWPGLLQPQTTSSGKVLGTVTDSTGAALFDVLVSVTNSQTGVSRQVKTDEYGKYVVGSLLSGIYRIRAEGGRVKTNQVTGVKLGAGGERTVNLVMDLSKQRLSAQLVKSKPVTMAQLAKIKMGGVSAVEISDYVYGNYKGPLAPSPPHADLNPKKAYIIFWKDVHYRFVFSHEASYCPWVELPSGAAVMYQFFEGNTGWAELFNNWGRQERNSSVDIIEPGPSRVWVRWTYYGVNMQTGERAYRATEDFWAYPNGLIVRRQSYETLMPNDYRGYSREPIELDGLCPVGKLWFNVLEKDRSTGENHALAVLDVFTKKRYDLYWKHKAGTLWDSTHSRSGWEWKDVDDARGVLVAVPMTDGAPFCVFGDASGFQDDFTRLKDHTFVEEIWGSKSWDHWPIGWLNSQAHEVDANSLKLYPNGFAPFGMDFFALPDQVEERGIYYSLIGIASHHLEPARAGARKWLEKGAAGIANDPDSGADLPPTFRGGKQ